MPSVQGREGKQKEAHETLNARYSGSQSTLVTWEGVLKTRKQDTGLFTVAEHLKALADGTHGLLCEHSHNHGFQGLLGGRCSPAGGELKIKKKKLNQQDRKCLEGQHRLQQS